MRLAGGLGFSMDVAHLDIARLVQSALAPVFLISGVASTLVVLTGRLARAVDRARRLENRLESGSTEPPVDSGEAESELKVLARRAFYINLAIMLCALSALLVTLVVVALFASALFDAHMALTIAVLFVGAMLLLTGAFLAFLAEVRIATTALRIGIRAHVESAAARTSPAVEKSAII
jgi:hypothetical protein